MSKLIKKNKKEATVKSTEFTFVPSTWEHPSNIKASSYVECCSSEMDENALNEALEAKLRQLIVEEYSNRPVTKPVSLHIQGHLTITPAHYSEATFWTTNADADICWRDSTKLSVTQQRAERQAPRC